MNKSGKKWILTGLVLVAAFAVFTYLVKTVDVKSLGVNGTNIGFSAINCKLHKLLGVNMPLYIITDWAGMVPIFVAFSFGIKGFIQLIKRRNLKKVDRDIWILGIHYMMVAALYVVFERLPVNYRPILIDGVMETSFPSSTTLLVLGVMPTLAEQVGRRCENKRTITAVTILSMVFSTFTVIGRLLSGVHWFTDILGSVIIGIGLFCLYKGFILMVNKKI